MKKIFHWIWGIAETADWNGRFPRPLWRWLLAWCDRRAGYGQPSLGETLDAGRSNGVDGSP